MLDTHTQTIGQLAAQRPEALAVFQRHGIDYCCGGDRSIDEACRQTGVDLATVLVDIDRAAATADPTSTTDWLAPSLTELSDHIEQTHHAFLHEQLPFITELLNKVVAAHGEHHPELGDVRDTFTSLRGELEPHMFKEERVLFPAIRNLEAAGVPLAMPFGSIQNPISVMEDDHADAGEALQRLRRLTGDYQIPDDACNAYRGLLEILPRLEADLHEHIHKENNIFFPRAIELERATSGPQ